MKLTVAPLTAPNPVLLRRLVLETKEEKCTIPVFAPF